jgi:RNA polymerase sigma-70 factor, ECF subfamily
MEQNREQAAFEEAVLPQRGILLRNARRMTSTPSEAEDLVQETLLKAFKAFDKLRPESQIRAWLLRIMRNTFISAWRRKRREKVVLQQGVDEQRAVWLHPEPPTKQPSQRPADDLDDEIVAALREVPASYRDCIILVDIHQKSYREAAALTKQPLGTVQSRLFRGRRILKGLLRDFAEREGYLQQAA